MPTEQLAAALAQLLAAAAQPAPASPAEHTLLTVPEAAEKLRVSRSTLYSLLVAGQIRGVKIGRRRFVPASEVARIVSGDAA